ncbi:DUF6090 family protein [Robiginitalea sp. IMCC44478]|uniref:DUF6090 family protein n=1 Tax=Robiginitalea sp. IMCC44478 TaxID=3459122 RepID=UPI0040431CBA
MLRFFRHIRQRLLTDNKISKYLLYAVGEILLVVIGILIALQVNSWNEAKQEERLAREYLNSLKSDLIKDKIFIENRYPDIREWFDDWKKFKLKTEDPSLATDSLIQLAQNEFNPSRPFPRAYNKNTITTLLSTGHIRLITKELANDILDYYAFMNKSLEDQQLNESVYQSAIISFTDKYSFESLEVAQSGPLLRELIWKDVDPKDLAPKLSRLIKTKGFVLASRNTELDSLLVKAKGLITKLDKYLDN